MNDSLFTSENLPEIIVSYICSFLLIVISIASITPAGGGKLVSFVSTGDSYFQYIGIRKVPGTETVAIAYANRTHSGELAIQYSRRRAQITQRANGGYFYEGGILNSSTFSYIAVPFNKKHKIDYLSTRSMFARYLDTSAIFMNKNENITILLIFFISFIGLAIFFADNYVRDGTEEFQPLLMLTGATWLSLLLFYWFSSGTGEEMSKYIGQFSGLGYQLNSLYDSKSGYYAPIGWGIGESIKKIEKEIIITYFFYFIIFLASHVLLFFLLAEMFRRTAIAFFFYFVPHTVRLAIFRSGGIEHIKPEELKEAFEKSAKPKSKAAYHVMKKKGEKLKKDLEEERQNSADREAEARKSMQQRQQEAAEKLRRERDERLREAERLKAEAAREQAEFLKEEAELAREAVKAKRQFVRERKVWKWPHDERKDEEEDK